MENLTNVKLTKEETKLLNYGTQYTIERPTASYVSNLAVETERAIKILATKLQNPYRVIVAGKLKQIVHKGDKRRLLYIMKQLKTNL
jgi:hypothetical protein